MKQPIKKTLKRWKQEYKETHLAARAALGGVISAWYLTCPVYASQAVIKKIDKIYSLVIGIVGAAGGIVLAWGIFEFAMAYQSHDSSSQTQALKKVVSGILMCAASSLVTLLN